jgi:hypothetical protein
MILAGWMDKALIAFLPTNAGSLTISTTPDSRILAFNLAVSLLTGILFGLVPALESARPQLAGTLKEQVGSIAGGKSASVRKALVVAQVALSLLLLIGAGLFIRSLRNLKDLDPGFHTGNLIAFEINPTLNGYPPERSLDFYRQLRENLDAIPGVEASSLAVIPVLTGDEWDNSMAVEGFAHKPTETPDPHMQFIAPDFFKTMHIPIKLGRDFRMSDVRGVPKVCIVNEKFARRYFKDGNALGRHIGMGGNPGTKLDIEIIGVAGDTKYESMRDEVPLEVYQPSHQVDFVIGMTAYVRTARQPDQAFAAVRPSSDWPSGSSPRRTSSASWRSICRSGIKSCSNSSTPAACAFLRLVGCAGAISAPGAAPGRSPYSGKTDVRGRRKGPPGHLFPGGRC